MLNENQAAKQIFCIFVFFVEYLVFTIPHLKRCFVWNYFGFIEMYIAAET